MKIIKVESCKNCVRGCIVWTGLTKAERYKLRQNERIHPDCPLPDHLPDATKKVETDHSVEANKMITSAREYERERFRKIVQAKIDLIVYSYDEPDLEYFNDILSEIK